MTPAIQKKICTVGSYAVGKTSLVRRFVEGIFDDRYLTNIGVKIDKKVVIAGGRTVNMVVWDLAGEDAMTTLRMSHMRGASGYILVADGCRAATLDKAEELHQRLQEPLGAVPFVLALNKADVLDQWEVTTQSVDRLRAAGWPVFLTSAKTGNTVEDLFLTLAQKMLAP